MHFRGDINSNPAHRNRFLKVTQLPDVLKTSEDGVAKIAQK